MIHKTGRIMTAALHCGVATWAMLLAGPALAQNASQATDPGLGGQTPQATTGTNQDNQEIVVTGTLIRGQAPTGQELVTLSSQDITQLGVTDTSQLLSSLPQDANFNSRPQVGNYGQYQTTNTPILRYLGGGSAGSSSTLLLVDGARLPGMGILQTSSDIDAIAPGAIARIETATDGGSATYGADAVGGVVNIITHKRFDGLEVSGHYGGADNYRQWNVSATAGKTWSNGSFWVSYDYTQHNELYNYERSYVHNLNYTTTPYSQLDTTCNPANVRNVLTGPLTPSTTCFNEAYKTFFPGEHRHSVTAGLDVDLSSAVNFNVKGFYMHRDAFGDGGPETYSNLFYGPGFARFGLAHTLLATGNLSAAFGNSTPTKTTLDTFRITPKFTSQLGGGWENITFFNYGEGYDRFRGPSLDATSLVSEATAGSFSPITGLFAGTAAGQAAQAYQAAYQSYSSGRDIITNARTVFDGPLFQLPGGAVRAAAGAEIMREEYTDRNGTAESNNLGSILANTARRTVKSVFGELSVPIVGEGNRMPGFYSLVFSAAGRYDHYSDFGGTFDPKLALSWKPVAGWTIRGNWGRSFQAPSLADSSAAAPPGFATVPCGTFGPCPAPATAAQNILLLYPGGSPGLQPQKATTWEIGTDIHPAVIPGMTASVTYYHINFKNKIDTPGFFSSAFYTNFPTSYIVNTPANPLTTAEIVNYFSHVSPSILAAGGFSNYANNPSSVGVLEDALAQNLSTVRTSGLDFSVDYKTSTSFGSIFGGVSGVYLLTYNTQAAPGDAFINLDGNSAPHLRLQTTAGVQFGALLGKVTWDLSGQYAVPPTAGNAFQAEVKSFSTVNLAFQYAPKWTGALADASITLNVDNVLDTNPPVYNGTNGAGYGYSGFTLGRFIELGLKKKF